jgi:hypothetical protein
MIVARGTVGGEGERLLLGDVIDVRTTTPDVCTVNDDDDRLRLGDGATQVKGKAIGRCVLDARVGEVAAALELDVVP